MHIGYINIADSDRLDFEFGGELLNDKGFTSSNGFTFNFTVTNTIQGDREESRVRQSAFDYILWPDEEVDGDNAVAKVSHGSDYDSWTRLDNEPAVTLQLVQSGITRTVPFGEVGTGINRDLDGHLYLIEGFEIPYEFCDTMFETIEVDCDDEYYRDTTSLNLGESQVFDILPDHLSSFVSLNWNWGGALSFPRQRDRDGDGLLAVDQGGVDTDDRDPDRDGDGLTDSHEVNYGLNPDEADTDFDGLTDSQELFYNTDPLKGDSDSDGLSDYVEIIQGWLIAYGSGQITRVWSDPLTADADGDALNDQQELIFGLHPQITDDPDSLDETVQFNHFDVTETNAPELLLQFEADNNATLFSDGSGSGHTAFCDQAGQDCPASRQDGRYGYGLDFDGVDDNVTVQGVELANRSFTIAAWTDGSYTNQTIFGQGTGLNDYKNLSFGTSGGKLYCSFGGAENTGLLTQVSINGLTHVACTYDITTNTRQVYINGISAAYDYPAQPFQGSGTLYIGRHARFNGLNLHGTVDEAAVYYRALSQSEIGLMKNGRYNISDSILAPNDPLTYQVTVTNTNDINNIVGLMSGSAPSIATDNEVEFFAVDSLESATVSGGAHVNDGAATSEQQFNAYAEAILDTGNVDVPATDANAGSLVVYVPFEDLPGSTQIENHVSATEYSCGNQCPFVGVPGRFDQGAYFDGIDNRIPEGTTNYLTPDYSVGMWVKDVSGIILDATSQDYSCSGGRAGLVVTADQVILSRPCGSATVNIELAPAVWNHLFVTVDTVQVSTNSYEAILSVYINGSLYGSAITGQSSSVASFRANTPRIGEDKTGSAPHLQGYLDDLRVYNGVALSAAAVLDLYEKQGATALDSHFDEEAGSVTFNDDSGNQLVGAPQALGCVVLQIPELGRYGGFGDEANDRVRVFLDGEVIHQTNYWYIGQGLAVYSSGSGTWKKIYYATVLCNPATLELEFWDEATQSATILHSTTLDPASSNFNGSQFIVGDCGSNICVKVSGERFTEASPTAGTDGRIGNTALFATDGAMQVPDPQGYLSNLQSFTMMVWLYPEKAGGYIIAGHKQGVNNQDGFVWRVTSDGRLELKGNWPATINVGPTPDKWQQVVVVQDVANSKMRWYIDGILVKETNILSFDSYAESDSDPLLIGGGNGSEYFRGQMDELVIYDYALSEGMVQSIYNRQARTFASSDTVNLVIDNDTPTTVELLSDYNYRLGGYNQLVVSTSDPTTEVKVLDAQINDLTALSTYWHGAVPCQENSYDVEVWCPAFTLNNEGAYQFRFRAVDAVGNETTSGLYDIYVDKTPPVISGSYNDSWIAASQEGNLKWSLPLNGSVSDPVLASGHPGSGVYTGTITVNLVDETGVVVTDTIQPATLDGSTWSIDYIIDGTRPQGRYTIWFTAEDLVGNVAETAVGAILLDERSPRAFLAPLSLPDNITGPVTISGIASEQVYWGGEAAKLSFEEVAGSTTFMDYSGSGNDATCTNCPSTTTGLFGQALAFDGVNDSLVFPKIVNPAEETFTAAAWFKADITGNTRLIFAQQNGSGTGRSWLYLIGNKLGTFFGGSGQSGTTPIAAGEWHHAAVTYDGVELRLYLDGQIELTSTVTIEPADGPMVIGSNKNLTSQLFQGSIDEVAFYPQALNAEQIFALAQTVAYGVN